jgi:hypothetical protein
LFLFLILTTPARADTFHLAGGGVVEGKVLEDLGTALRVRTSIGVIDIEKEAIQKREPGRTAWDDYEDRQKKCPNTAAAHFELSQWCEKNNLRTERIDELKLVIKLDPNHAKARAALGYKKENGRWTRHKPTSPADAAARQARLQSEKDAKLQQKLVAEWFVKIKAIHRGRLAAKSGPRRAQYFREGRDQIMTIDEPLAIGPVTSVLSAGDEDCRRLMVEWLDQFKQDEATLNLIVIALLDPAEKIREQAALSLFKRKDGRIVNELLDALRSDDEFILRNAAAALGVLKATEAIEDLVSVLSTQTRQAVVISRPAYLDGIYDDYSGLVYYHVGGGYFYYRPTGIGCLGPGTFVGTVSQLSVEWVDVHRTQVQEALIQITGQNFGFDERAWLKWNSQRTQSSGE